MSSIVGIRYNLMAIEYKFLYLMAIEYIFKGLRPVLEGFVVPLHEGACKTGSQIPRALARGAYVLEVRAVSRAPPIVTSRGAP